MQWAERIGRRLKLRELHVLMTVAQHGSMAKAARDLAISQPVVSKTVAELERTLGLKLLDRTRDGIEPTLYGRALLSRAVIIFDELRHSIEELTFLSDPTTGELRIGCTDATMVGILPVLISQLHRSHPGLIFHLTQGVSGASLLNELRNRNVELAIGTMAADLMGDDLQVEPLFDEPTIVVAGIQNRWSRRRSIDLAELIDEPWSLPQPDSAAGRRVAEIFRVHGLPMPRASVICSSVTMHNALVVRGSYLAMSAGHVFAFNKRLSIKILPVRLPALSGPTGIVFLKNRTLSPLAQMFIASAREVASELPQRWPKTAAKTRG